MRCCTVELDLTTSTKLAFDLTTIFTLSKHRKENVIRCTIYTHALYLLVCVLRLKNNEATGSPSKYKDTNPINILLEMLSRCPLYFSQGPAMLNENKHNRISYYIVICCVIFQVKVLTVNGAIKILGMIF